MRIQLVHPPVCLNRHALQATRPAPPLGLAYLAAAVRAAGHRVSVLDAFMAAPEQARTRGRISVLGMTPQAIAANIAPDTQVVGLSGMFSFAWPQLREILRAVRAARPDVLLVGGGEHFTGMTEQCLRETPLVYVVRGEGETTLVALLDALDAGADPRSVPGLAWCDAEGAFRQSAPRARERDVDALPWPAWDLFDLAGYHARGLVLGQARGFTVPMLATRGCPYACTFCSNAMMWGRHWFARRPADVVAEMQTWHARYGATNFPFHDLTAVLRRSWILDFCDALEAAALPVTWQLPVGTRCEVVDDEVARRLYQTGCRSITFAPETGSLAMRDAVQKRMTDAALLRAVRASANAGLNVSAFFVIGFPGDTPQSLRASIGLARRLADAGCHDIALTGFFPVPGTVLFDALAAEGRVTYADTDLEAPLYAMEARLREATNYCRALSARQLTYYKYAILARFYARQYLRRPQRILALADNIVRGHEAGRLEAFLLQRLRRGFTRAARLPSAAPTAPAD